MHHPSLVAWEKKLKAVLDELDDVLEERFGGQYTLHPARAQRGRTSNKSHDGLFDIVASYTIGAGSQHGGGYVVDVDIATLDTVPDDIQKEIETIALDKLKETLPKHFPETDLRVTMDGHLIKIVGDLSLGSA